MLINYLNSPPGPFGPYSTVVWYRDLIFVSGQIPVDENGEVVGRTPGEQVEKALQQLYKAAGWPEEEVACLSIRVYAVNLEKAASDINQAYEKFHSYNQLPYPAREMVGVSALPRGALVEVAGIFARKIYREER